MCARRSHRLRAAAICDEEARLALYFVHYNFRRIHKTLRVAPTMAAGITDKLRTMEDVVALIDADAPKPGPRGPYQKKQPVA